MIGLVSVVIPLRRKTQLPIPAQAAPLGPAVASMKREREDDTDDTADTPPALGTYPRRGAGAPPEPDRQRQRGDPGGAGTEPLARAHVKEEEGGAAQSQGAAGCVPATGPLGAAPGPGLASSLVAQEADGAGSSARTGVRAKAEQEEEEEEEEREEERNVVTSVAQIIARPMPEPAAAPAAAARAAHPAAASAAAAAATQCMPCPIAPGVWALADPIGGRHYLLGAPLANVDRLLERILRFKRAGSEFFWQWERPLGPEAWAYVWEALAGGRVQPLLQQRGERVLKPLPGERGGALLGLQRRAAGAGGRVGGGQPALAMRALPHGPQSAGGTPFVQRPPPFAHADRKLPSSLTLHDANGTPLRGPIVARSLGSKPHNAGRQFFSSGNPSASSLSSGAFIWADGVVPFRDRESLKSWKEFNGV